MFKLFSTFSFKRETSGRPSLFQMWRAHGKGELSGSVALVVENLSEPPLQECKLWVMQSGTQTRITGLICLAIIEALAQRHLVT